MSPHVATVTQLCLKFMTFDPNYNDDEEEEEEDSMDIEDGLDEGLCVNIQFIYVFLFLLWQFLFSVFISFWLTYMFCAYVLKKSGGF